MKKILFVAAIAAVGAMTLTSCGKKEETVEIKLGSQLNLDTTLAECGTAVAADTTYVKDYVYGDKTVATTVIDKIVKPSDDIYLSISVAYPTDDAAVNATLGQILSSIYTSVTDTKVTPADASDIAADVTLFADNFANEVAPAYAKSVAPAFNLTVNMQPDFAKNNVVTYAIYSDYYTGGAHGISDFYYASMADGKLLTANDIFKAESLPEVRKMIVATIADTKGQSVEDYLKSLNEYLMSEAGKEVTVENFPIDNIGLTQDGVVVSYPTYSIAPASEGNPSYLLPADAVIDYLAI